jgi:murein DD-endopeptidase MepM/ murein hydrolase activator NlpD
MKYAQDYPVTLPYGATYPTPPYSRLNPHHGCDYGAPKGTVVKVGSLKIGTVGSTGFAFGAHLHVDKHRYSVGSYPLGIRKYLDPKGWSTIKGTVVYAGWLGTAGKTVIIKTEAGTYFRFLHLDKIVTSKGKKTY